MRLADCLVSCGGAGGEGRCAAGVSSCVFLKTGHRHKSAQIQLGNIIPRIIRMEKHKRKKIRPLSSAPASSGPYSSGPAENSVSFVHHCFGGPAFFLFAQPRAMSGAL